MTIHNPVTIVSQPVDIKQMRRTGRWFTLAVVVGIIVTVLYTLTAINADTAATSAVRLLTTERVSSAQRSAQLLRLGSENRTLNSEIVTLSQENHTLLQHLTQAHKDSQSILIALKGDTRQITAFANYIKTVLGAVCTATQCVIKLPPGTTTTTHTTTGTPKP